MSLEFKQTTFVKTAVDAEGWPKMPLPHVAIAGRSNVGKSTLLNYLFQRKGLAKTSSTPGKTQALQFFSVDERLLIADLPGYGYSKVSGKISSTWGAMIEAYLTQNERLKGILLLIDIRHDPSAQDLQFLEWARSLALPVTVVLTKADKLSKNQCASQTAHLTRLLGLHSPPIVTSADGKIGRQLLVHHLNGLL
ncbi:MAG: ribosome biogenesis GTP-binding protein YihA/YsxC [Parachlamydiales bacterium]